MSIQRKHRRLPAALSLIVALAGICQIASAQEQAGDLPEEVDEITVLGEKSLFVLRNELYRAEEDFLDLFNSLNSTNEFDFKCEKFTATQARRRYHVCIPRFAAKAEAQASAEMVMGWHRAFAQRTVRDLDSYTNRRGAQVGFVQRKERQMWDEMAVLVREKQEMREALAKLEAAKNNYDEARRQRSRSRNSAE